MQVSCHVAALLASGLAGRSIVGTHSVPVGRVTVAHIATVKTGILDIGKLAGELVVHFPPPGGSRSPNLKSVSYRMGHLTNKKCTVTVDFLSLIYI